MEPKKKHSFASNGPRPPPPKATDYSPYCFPQQVVRPGPGDFKELFKRIGFTAQVATYLVDQECMDCFPSVAVLTDGEIDTICSIICKGQEGVQEMPVAITAQNNLKLCAFKMKHWIHATYYIGAIHPGHEAAEREGEGL